MKKLVLLIAKFAYYLFTVYILMIFIWYSPSIKPLLSDKPTIKEWKYKGHDMLLYEYKNSYSICHSPVCRKCYQIYD